LELWVLLSVGAAFLQNLRSALQKSLTGKVDVIGATYARFLFAAPLAAVLAAALIAAQGAAPGLTAAFVGWAILGGAGQITAQVLLLQLFKLRNFAVGNAFARTESVQAAILGAVLLGDWLSPAATAGILISATGVVLLSTASGWRGGLLSRATAIGLGCGAVFAVSAVSYRAASLALEGEAGFLLRAAFTLAFVTLAQTVAMSLWMRLRRPGAITGVLRLWRPAAATGAVGMLASLGWFTAFTLTSAAEVKAVGQVELLFSFLTSRFAFGERPSLREIAGISLVAGGIVLLVLTA
jgi:drug/metabolite transporter (DMT)-like permease